MNAVGIDISKGKSTVAVMQPLGVVVAEPFDVFHTDSDLKNLTAFIKSLPGETKVVIECTGIYYEPVANTLHNAGIFVSAVNPLLIDDYDVGKVYCSQLIAENGDINRLKSTKLLVALADIDSPPNQSGKVERKSRKISKRDSPALRKILFQIMIVYLENIPTNEPCLSIYGQETLPR